MSHSLAAAILAASHLACFAAGLIAERRRVRRLRCLTPLQAGRHIEPPERAERVPFVSIRGGRS